MTLIVLLILAAISLSAVFSEKGIFNRAENAGAKYSEAKAREVLETVLLADGQYEKHNNPEYDQHEFLNELIINEIPGTEIKGDVAIIGEWAFELDRSVPKIGRILGKADKLVFPTITITEPVLADNHRTATFTVTASETKNGINKIEIWLNGERLDKLTKTYENIKTEIKEDYTVNRNGKYTVKVYASLMSSEKTTVEGIVPAVEFLPNGNSEWKKEHTTTITVKETGEKVTGIKYQWTNSIEEPEKDTFTEECTNNSTITTNRYTGKYYLWVLLETENNHYNICGSEEFYFDNEGPTVNYILGQNGH